LKDDLQELKDNWRGSWFDEIHISAGDKYI